LIYENISLSGLAIAGALHYKRLSVNEIRQHALKLGLKVRKL